MRELVLDLLLLRVQFLEGLLVELPLHEELLAAQLTPQLVVQLCVSRAERLAHECRVFELLGESSLPRLDEVLVQLLGVALEVLELLQLELQSRLQLGQSDALRDVDVQSRF